MSGLRLQLNSIWKAALHSKIPNRRCHLILAKLQNSQLIVLGSKFVGGHPLWSDLKTMLQLS